MSKVLIDLVVSLNGMIARENGDEDWLPEGGWDAFIEQIGKYRNVIVGRETYELVKAKYKHDNFDAIKTTVKIILTTQKDYRASGNGYIIAHTPEEAIKIVEQSGLDTAYVGGGGAVCAAFLNAELVDEIQLTIMPCIIPTGRSFVSTALLHDVALTLLDSKRLQSGQIVNTYQVNKGVHQ